MAMKSRMRIGVPSEGAPIRVPRGPRRYRAGAIENE